MNSHHYTGGRSQPIADLLKETGAAAHSVEAWGNSREGFEPYLVHTLPDGAGGTFTSGVAIGPRYRTLAGLRLDVQRAYGLGVRVRQGRGWL
jgi:hypothetical protein